MSKRDVYWFMKNGTSSIEDLSISEVGEMLEFLSSPFVGCIGKDKDGYYAVGSFDDAAKRLVLLAKACNGLRWLGRVRCFILLRCIVRS